MRRITLPQILSITVATLLAIVSMTEANAQAVIETREFKLSDFSYKTTKVVLSGNPIFDETLKAEVASRWNISPYEFCTMDDFNTLKTSAEYYFIVPIKVAYKGRPSLSFLTVLKGGNADIDKMFEVAAFPVCSATSPSGRELVFMGAILDALQENVRKGVSGSPFVTVNKTYRRKIRKDLHTKQVVMSTGDLCPSVDTKTFDSDMSAISEEQANEDFVKGPYNYVFSYVIAPEDAQDGDWCITILFGADDHKIYYMSSHKVHGKNGVGFTSKDIAAIRVLRKMK